MYAKILFLVWMIFVSYNAQQERTVRTAEQDHRITMSYQR